MRFRGSFDPCSVPGSTARVPTDGEQCQAALAASSATDTEASQKSSQFYLSYHIIHIIINKFVNTKYLCSLGP
jgi:hypothetical protein